MIPWWLNPWVEARDLRKRFDHSSRAFWREHARALNAEAELRLLKEARREAKRKEIETKRAKRKALQEATTEKLRQNHA